MLLLVRAVFSQLTNDFLSKTRRLRHHLVQSFEHLLETLIGQGGPIVRHSCRKDYLRVVRR